MKKFLLFLFIILGTLTFLLSANFKFLGDNHQNKSSNTYIKHDSIGWHGYHEVYNDYRPNLVVPPRNYNQRSKNNRLQFTNVDISNNSPAPQNEPSVRVNKKNPNQVVAAWRDFRISYNPAFRRVGYSFSTNGGVTWSVSALLDSTLLGSGLLRNSDPSVTSDSSGNFYITTIALDNTNGNTSLAIYKSTDGGNTFPIGHVVAQGESEDKEMVTCDMMPGSPYKNTIYISWTRIIPYIINVVKSTDGGQTWSTPVAVNNTTTQGTGSVPVVGMNGELYIVWVGGSSSDVQYFSKSTDGGNTFSSPQSVASGPSPYVPWSQSGYLSFPSVAADISGGSHNGNIYVSWSDATNGDADVFLSRSTDHGGTWSSPLRVNDDPVGNGKIQTWPWITVNDSGKISIVYFDTRNTPNDSTTESWIAVSSDGGSTFTNEDMSTQQSQTNRPNSDVRYGDYIGIDSWGGHTVPVWTDQRAGGFDMEIYTAIGSSTYHDIACGPFLSLPSSFIINQAYAIKTEVQNLGTVNETNVPISFYINGTLTNTTNINLTAGQVDSVNNNWTPAVAGTYTLMYVSSLVSDQNRNNDTVRVTVDVNASVPELCEGFSTSLFPPQNWSVVYTGTDYWSRSPVSGFCIDSGSANFDNYFAPQNTQQQLITETLTSPTGSSDTLVFQEAYATYQTEDDQLQILTSTNAGTNWTSLVTLDGGVSGPLVTAPPTTNVFVPTCTQWKYQNFLLPPQTNMIQFNAISAFGNELYIDSICLHLGIGIKSHTNDIPRTYSLSQNYPNPFNPTTKIQFALPKAGMVKLVIYDILGAEVATPVNEYKQPGYYNISFNGQNLASGVYFYRIISGSFVQVKKMVLLK